jgi:hypothetical protein
LWSSKANKQEQMERRKQRRRSAEEAAGITREEPPPSSHTRPDKAAAAEPVSAAELTLEAAGLRIKGGGDQQQGVADPGRGGSLANSGQSEASTSKQPAGESRGLDQLPQIVGTPGAGSGATAESRGLEQLPQLAGAPGDGGTDGGNSTDTNQGRLGRGSSDATSKLLSDAPGSSDGTTLDGEDLPEVSQTYISMDANALSMFAGTATGYKHPSGNNKDATPGVKSPSEPRQWQRRTGAQRRRTHFADERASSDTSQNTVAEEISDGLRAVNLGAPDAKSSAATPADATATAEYPQVPALESSSTGTEILTAEVPSASSASGQEEIDENDPGHDTKLTGGRDGGEGSTDLTTTDSAHAAARHNGSQGEQALISPPAIGAAGAAGQPGSGPGTRSRASLAGAPVHVQCIRGGGCEEGATPVVSLLQPSATFRRTSDVKDFAHDEAAELSAPERPHPGRSIDVPILMGGSRPAAVPPSLGLHGAEGEWHGMAVCS